MPESALEPTSSFTQTDGSGTTTYTWDARNRLVGISGPTVSATFAYDALGRRVSKHVLSEVEGRVNAVTTTYLYDGLDIVGESGGGGDARYLRTLSIDEALSRTDAGGTTAYLLDILGSTVALADGSGTPVTSYTYEPFGDTSVAGAPSPNAFQFTGREKDGTGLYYYRARYYDPVRSRFVSEDPLGLAGGTNLYQYVDGNPIGSNDPTGLDPWFREEIFKWRHKRGVPTTRNAELYVFTMCMRKCVAEDFTLTSTHEINIQVGHTVNTPHTRGEAIDIRYPRNPTTYLCCAKKCGAGYGLDEKLNPSQHSSAPHFHLQLGRGKREGSGDLPAAKQCDPCGNRWQ